MGKRIIPEIPGYTKIQVVSFVKMKLLGDDKWAKAACLALYEQQTLSEKQTHLSKGHNGCGFGRVDSPLLTHIACKIKQNRATLEDLNTLKMKLPRYAKQLICLSIDKDEGKNLKFHLDQYYNKKKGNTPW